MLKNVVIIDCAGSVDGLKKTLSSLAKQNLVEFAAVVLYDAEQESAVESLLDDDRFHSESKSTPLSQLAESYPAESYILASAGTQYSTVALENLYGALKARSADIVIGRGDIRLFDWREKHIATFNGQAQLDVFKRQSFNLRESESFGNLVATKGLIDFVPTDNKIYSRRILLECADGVCDYSFASRWLFHVRATLKAHSIFGVKAQGCRISYLIVSKTPLRTREDFIALTNAFDKADVEIAQADILACSDAPNRTDEDVFFRREYLRRWLICYKLCAFLKLWSYWCLSMDDELRHSVEETMRQAATRSPEQWVDFYFGDRKDLFGYFLDLHEGQDLVITPMVAFVLMPGISETLAQEQAAQLERQEIPNIELLVPSSQNYASQLCEEFAQAKIVDYDGGPIGQWMNHIINSVTKSKYIVFLEDKIFWTGSSVTRSVHQLEINNPDCLIARPTSKKESNLRVFEFAIPSVAETRVSEAIPELDNSFSNKMFRVKALKAKRFAFSDDPIESMRTIRDSLVCATFPSIRLLCKEKNTKFLSRASQTARLKYKIAYRRVDRDAQKRKKAQFDRNKKTPVIKNQILFTTNRATGALSPHLQAIYDVLPGEKIVLSQTTPHTREFRNALIREIRRSRVIITDDYVHEIRGIKLADNQFFYQTWHAYGAFKKFGLDCFGMPIVNEIATHEQYTNVFVSSDGIVDIYANAFGIERERVIALGSPNADKLLDPAFIEAAREKTLELYPSITGKRVIAYCPTFRQNLRRVMTWHHGIIWDELEKTLEDVDAIMLVKPHPFDDGTFSGLNSDMFNSIKLVSDLDADSLIAASDLLITDYSSVVFNAALLDKPFMLYCPDFDTYQRDYYLDFPDELPAQMTKTFQELLSAIREGGQDIDRDAYAEFKNKYLGACDGHSAQRIAEYICKKL